MQGSLTLVLSLQLAACAYIAPPTLGRGGMVASTPAVITMLAKKGGKKGKKAKGKAPKASSGPPAAVPPPPAAAAAPSFDAAVPVPAPPAAAAAPVPAPVPIPAAAAPVPVPLPPAAAASSSASRRAARRAARRGEGGADTPPPAAVPPPFAQPIAAPDDFRSANPYSAEGDPFAAENRAFLDSESKVRAPSPEQRRAWPCSSCSSCSSSLSLSLSLPPSSPLLTRFVLVSQIAISSLPTFDDFRARDDARNAPPPAAPAGFRAPPAAPATPQELVQERMFELFSFDSIDERPADEPKYDWTARFIGRGLPNKAGVYLLPYLQSGHMLLLGVLFLSSLISYPGFPLTEVRRTARLHAGLLWCSSSA